MTRQQQVFIEPPVGVEGGLASTNPIRSVVAGPGALVAASSGARVGYFNWIQADGTVAAFAPDVATSGPTVPDGILLNEGQAQITEFLGQTSMVVQQGQNLTLVDRADVWVRGWYETTNRNKKAFANIFTGQVAFGDAGGFVDLDVEDATFVGFIDQGTNLLHVTSVVGGTISVGGLLEDSDGNIIGTIAANGTGSGSTGTYFLNAKDYVHGESQTFTTSGNALLGFQGTASFATDEMTVVSTTFGTVAVGQLVKSAGVAAGTYVKADLGSGVWQLSTTPGTITTQAASTSPWIETPWYAESNGNAGDLVIIGIKN